MTYFSTFKNISARSLASQPGSQRNSSATQGAGIKSCHTLHVTVDSCPLLHSRWGYSSKHLHRHLVLARSSEQPQGGDEGNTTPSTPVDKEQGVEKKILDVKGEDSKDLQISKEVIEKLKFTVFGFDTFWVTSVENYQSDGVVFKGNVRGKDPQASYLKLKERMATQLGLDYTLFMLEDQEGKATVVVLPKSSANEGTISKGTEVYLAILFAVLTAVTTANANGIPLLQFLLDPFRTEISIADVRDAIPPALAFWFTLGAHEWGHQWAAKRRGVELYLPFIVPAGFGFLGSFGGITRIRGFAPSREALLDVAASGPLVGASVAGALTFTGFVLSAAGITDVSIDSPSFADSFLMAVAAQAFLGERLLQPVVEVNSLLVAGWAGLVVNALNCIPAGELDGGRIALAIWGRRTYNILGIASTGVLAVTALASSLSFYWIGLVLFLQRGPILPCAEELSEVKDERALTTGLLLLALPLLILAPFPTELLLAAEQLGQASF